MIIKTLSRRQALGLIGVAGAAGAIGCGSDSTAGPSATPTTTGTTGGTGAVNAACAPSPDETIGPYPSLTNFIRSDIREGKSGLPLALTITVLNASADCGPVANAAVDIWQCDATGNYSEYSQPGYNGSGQTFLRGIQTSDASGRVNFTTVFPGWYQGRATHIHVEVKVNGRAVKVTQIAFDPGITAAVYRTGVYASRGQNPTSNASDMVFADSVASELATITGGDAGTGYSAEFTVRVAV
jgi:protocatechuate 3,4-dioxygenase beta subunit